MPTFYKPEDPDYHTITKTFTTYVLTDVFPKHPEHHPPKLDVYTNDDVTQVLFVKEDKWDSAPIGVWNLDELVSPRHDALKAILLKRAERLASESADEDEDDDDEDDEDEDAPDCTCSDCRRARGEDDDPDYEEPEGDSEPMTPAVALSSSEAQHAQPWDLVTFALDARTPRMALYGPPGTGKTMTAFLWAKAHGWQCLSTTLTEDTPMTELRGHFVLKGHEFVWHDGLIARAWRMSHEAPVLVILNEIDHASGDTSTFLHNALDDPEMARLDLPNDETISPRAENLMYVATMNGVPEDLSDALRDRFPVRIPLPKPNPAAIEGLPPELRTFGANLGSRKELTLRGLYEFARLMKTSKNVPMSAKLVFGDAYADIVHAMKLAE